MTQISFVILFVVFVSAGVSCNDTTLGDLPQEVKQQLQGILENSMKYELKPDCKTRLRSNVEFLLYTRNNQDEGEILNISNPKHLDPTKKLVLLIHGWLSGPTTSGIIKMKNAYLKRYDCNVIVVNWSKVAKLPYSTSYCHIPAIAQYVAKALCYLKRQVDIDLEKIHIVGHSMGVHIAGWVGKYITTKCMGRIGRITALDPSGPIFGTLPENRRLDKTDALFVDVIHTDGEKFGSTNKHGHSDFYPNCGQHQPGCPTLKEVNDDTLLSDAFCSHHRSMEYMAESILSSDFIAVSCGLCPRYCRADLISEVHRVMGEDCNQESHVTRNFYIPTKDSAPYFKGWDAYSGVSDRFV